MQVKLENHWHDGGMDFGDALHLALSAKEIGFKSLDEAFAKDRQGAGSVSRDWCAE